jgi:heptosyltransferase-3
MNFKGVEKILIIKLRHIGDVLLSFPVFRALRENFPDAHISVLVNKGTEKVLTGNPFINEIIVFERDIKKMNHFKKYAEELSFLKCIQKKRFDMTIDLTGGDRAAIISFISGARYRLGWKSKKGFIGKKYLYTHLSEPDRKSHIVLQNLDIIKQFGIGTDNLSIDFHVSEEDSIFVKTTFKINNIKKDDTVVHVHPTSRWLFKCWKDEYMAEIITWLVEQGIKVVVTSSPDKKEMDKVKRILSIVSEFTPPHIPPLPKGCIGGVIDLCGKITIKQLSAISEVSDLFFGIDSAPMHIAAAVGTPVIAMFGPSGAFHWGPWDNNQSTKNKTKKSEKTPYPNRNGFQTFGMHTVIQRDWDCIPCGNDGCNGSKKSRCLEEISTEEVKKILAEKIEVIKK